MSKFKSSLVIAINGRPVSGKTTVAEYVSRRLPALRFSPGILFRMLAKDAIDNGITPRSPTWLLRSFLTHRCRQFQFSVRSGRLTYWLDGSEVDSLGPTLRTKNIEQLLTRATPLVADSVLGIGERLLDHLKTELPIIVIDGISAGTLLARDSHIKIFLERDVNARVQNAYRRWMEAGEPELHPAEAVSSFLAREATDDRFVRESLLKNFWHVRNVRSLTTTLNTVEALVAAELGHLRKTTQPDHLASVTRHSEDPGMGQYDLEYRKSPCFWGKEPGKYVGLLSRYLRSGKVLDLGAGEGKNAFYLASMGCNITAVDVSFFALRTLEAIRRSEHQHANIKTIHGDVRRLRLDGRYDAVVAYGLLHCLSSKEEIIRTVSMMKALTRENGFNVICTFTDKLPVPEVQSYLLPTFLKPFELPGFYTGWRILNYEEDVITESHPTTNILHQHSVARLIAQKR